MMMRHMRASERGSMPLALLATFMITALVVVLVATVIVGQRQTTFDKRFESALQVAEVGLDQLQYLTESGALKDKTEYVTEWTPAEGGEGRYVMYAKKAGGSWYLESTGEVNGVRRTVTKGTAPTSLLQYAAFSEFHFVMRGDNRVDSYESGTWGTGPDGEPTFDKHPDGSDVCQAKNGHPASVRRPDGSSSPSASKIWMCNPVPGYGVVGTNGEMDILGQGLNHVDEVRIHYSKEIENPLTGARGYCDQLEKNCNNSEKVKHFRKPLLLERITPQMLGLSEEGATRFHPDDGDNVLPAGPQVYTDVTLDSFTEVQGTPENPTVVLFKGTLEIPNKQVVNFERSGSRWIPRPAPSLYLIAYGYSPVYDLGVDIHIAGALYGPNAVVNADASGDVYGGLVSGELDPKGSWGFHFDKALLNAPTLAPPKAANWTEIPSEDAFGPQMAEQA